MDGISRHCSGRSYCKPVNISCVGDEELRDAWRSDKLGESIYFRSSQLQPNIIGEELKWFQTYRHFAANSVTDFGQILDSARDVLSWGERDAPMDQLDSETKQHAYLFLSQIRNAYVPDADEDNCLRLGFCTA